MNKEIRRYVFARANGICECGCGKPLDESSQLDHVFGRAKAEESIENCWALTLQCHDDKTNNRPNAARWCGNFQEHCNRHGYLEASKRAYAKLMVQKFKGFA